MKQKMDYIEGLRFRNHKSHKDTIAEIYHFNKYYITEQAKDAFIDAQECMSKQIPKKPEIITTGKKVGLQEVNCPSCHKFFGEKIKGDAILFHIPNYCECCGQRLDWEV